MIRKINKKFVYDREALQDLYNTHGLVDGAKKLGRCTASFYKHLKAANITMKGRGNKNKHIRKVILIDD